jgi:hypothetical protein
VRARCPPSDGSVRSAPHHQRHPPGGTDPECRHPLQLTERDPALSRNRWRRHRWCWSGWRRRRWRVGCWRGRHDGRRAAAHTSQACGRWTEGAVSVEYMYAQPAVATGQGPLLLLACHVCGGGRLLAAAGRVPCAGSPPMPSNPESAARRRSTLDCCCSCLSSCLLACCFDCCTACCCGCGLRRAARVAAWLSRLLLCLLLRLPCSAGLAALPASPLNTA